MPDPETTRVRTVTRSLRSSAGKDARLDYAPSQTPIPQSVGRLVSRDRGAGREQRPGRWRLTARWPASSAVSSALARNDGRRPARGSVLRRLILALPEIRPPERARTPLSIDSAPAIDQPSAKEGFGRSQPARRAKPEASAPGEEAEKATSPAPAGPAPSENPQWS